MPTPHPLAERLPSLILGGAGGFSYSTHPDPLSIPAEDIVRRAFDLGMLAIDTSPYYEPSEELLGRALAHPRVAARYSRSDYVLMTKVGRIGDQHFDYSPTWVRKSVLRSLERLGTTYLDVVFCHDIESVTDEDTLDAVGVLLEFVQQDKIKYIGLSSYRIDILAHRANFVREKYGRPIDVVQNWGQLTIQNSRLESEGLQALAKAGVTCICTSSPLAIGLLRKGGVPIGKHGDTHPAPEALRRASQEAAMWVESQGDTLAAVALRYTLWRAHENSTASLFIHTVTGISSVAEVNENVEAARKLLLGDFFRPTLDKIQVKKDILLWHEIRNMLGSWVNWCFSCPPDGWSQELKRMVRDEENTGTT